MQVLQVDHGDALKAHYRQFYFEALDLITNCISQRFDQRGYQNYKFLQELLVKAVKGEEYLSELKVMCNFHGEDICESRLKTQLETLASMFKDQEKTSLADMSSHSSGTVPLLIRFFFLKLALS